jgi:hypothetical protein
MINEQSPELYALSKRYPGVPVFPGPIIDWPDWWWHDETILRTFERQATAAKKKEDKNRAWREAERKKMLRK